MPQENEVQKERRKTIDVILMNKRRFCPNMQNSKEVEQ
jgi:hypothetical protein